MSMSWEHKCRKCGKEFDSFAPRQPFCYDCTEVSKIKDLPKNRIIRITDFGGYQYACLFVEDLMILGDMEIVTNDSDFRLVLEMDEIRALENHLGREIIWVKK